MASRRRRRLNLAGNGPLEDPSCLIAQQHASSSSAAAGNDNALAQQYASKDWRSKTVLSDKQEQLHHGSKYSKVKIMYCLRRQRQLGATTIALLICFVSLVSFVLMRSRVLQISIIAPLGRDRGGNHYRLKDPSSVRERGRRRRQSAMAAATTCVVFGACTVGSDDGSYWMPQLEGRRGAAIAAVSVPIPIYRGMDDTPDRGEGDNVFNITLLQRGQSRHIQLRNDETRYERERAAQLKRMDKRKSDEPKMHTKHEPDDAFAGKHHECYRTNWRSRTYPTCNQHHEIGFSQIFSSRLDVQNHTVVYEGRGHYRVSWSFHRRNRALADTFVWKAMRLVDEFDVDFKRFFQISRDAIIMERLSGSPRMVDMYGYCGTSILAEYMPYDIYHEMVYRSGDISKKKVERLQKEPVRSMNKLTLAQKVNMATAIAESLADLAGFDGGVIVHGDASPFQWLRASKTGRIKLNDFNQGEILDFNPVKGEYCKTRRCYPGSFRSPEEIQCTKTNEAIDTYSMGNNMYVLLTGLWPFYQFVDMEDDELDNLILEKKTHAYIDPRFRTMGPIVESFIDIMEQCWEWNPDKRISIFDVVKKLRSLQNNMDQVNQVNN